MGDDAQALAISCSGSSSCPCTDRLTHWMASGESGVAELLRQRDVLRARLDAAERVVEVARRVRAGQSAIDKAKHYGTDLRRVLWAFDAHCAKEPA